MRGYEKNTGASGRDDGDGRTASSLSTFFFFLYLSPPNNHDANKITKSIKYMGVTWQTHSSILALLGGILIGAVAVVRHAIVGKITGISGILNGSTIYKLNKFPYEEKLFKILFTLGVCLGGLLCYYLFPKAFVDWSKIPIERLLIAGFLVGLGSAIGNGCTSGHGVCGISSLRLRSMVATGVFMTTGILTAIFTKSLSYFPEFDNQLDMSSASIAFAVALIVCMLLYYIGSLLSRGSHGQRGAVRTSEE